MQRWGHAGLRLLVLLAIFLIAGCATPKRAAGTFDIQNHWQGRLAIKVLGTPPQAFSADFELDGHGEAGTLALLSPLGTTVAHMQWAPGMAQLRNGSELRNFESLSALAQQATGTELPVAALFDWLRGTATPAPGWEADLSQLSEGRLQAQRQADAAPAVELRIILER
jgi:outer membrane lipoprotein LolB